MHLVRNLAALSLLGLLLSGVAVAQDTETTDTKTTGQKQAKKGEVIELFNGKDLTGWKKTNFGGEGDVEVKNGQVILGFGNDMTGITYTKPLPKMNYEITLQAMRVDGNDFFCGLTFPVGKDHCSLIIGGWGGGLTGLSTIDKMDASENDTTTLQEYKQKTWYPIRLRVTPDRITAWVGKKEVLSQPLEDRIIGIRPETELNRPLGFASYQTTAALKNIKLRKLPMQKTEKE